MKKVFISGAILIYFFISLFTQNISALTLGETVYYHGIDIYGLKLSVQGIKETLIPQLDTRIYYNTIKIRTLEAVKYPRKRIVLSNNGAEPDHAINTAAGFAVFPNFSSSVWAVPFKKKINEAWMIGSGNGGLADNLLVSAATWYHVFALSDSRGSFIDYGFDTSLTAANLLSDPAVVAAGITRYSRQGSILTDEQSNIRPFIQSGKFFQWSPAILNYNLNFISVGAGPNLRIISAPLGIVTKAKIRLNHQNTGAGVRLGMFASPGENISAPESCPPCFFNFATGSTGDFKSSELEIYTDLFSKIKEQWDSGGKAGIYTIYSVGYEDFNLL